MNSLTLSQSATIEFCWSSLDHPSKEIRQFVQQYADDATRNVELRNSSRYPVAMEVARIPFDTDERQCGNPLLMLSRNISAGGISLVHIRPVPAHYLLVEFGNDEQDKIRAVVEVVRCRRIGRFFEVAGKFKEKLAK